MECDLLREYRECKTEVPKEGDTNKKQVQVYSHQRILRHLRRKELRLKLL